MRTDVKIDIHKRLRTGIVTPIGASTVGRGDLIEWSDASAYPHVGRVICAIKPTARLDGDAPDVIQWYLCVAMTCGGVVAERWVKPSDVISAYPPTKLLEWLMSDAFLRTDVDTSRDAYNRTGADLLLATME